MVSTSTPSVSAPSPLVAYFQSVWAEAKKVTWPSKAQIWANTLTVVIMTALFSAGLFAIDNVFHGLIMVLTQWLPRTMGWT